MEYVTMKNEEKAREIAKENAYEWRDQEYGDVSSEEDCYESAMAMADFKDNQTISELDGWHTEPPTEDSKVLLEMESKHETYVVAGWSSHDKCFYDSNEQKYTKWERWKKI